MNRIASLLVLFIVTATSAFAGQTYTYLFFDVDDGSDKGKEIINIDRQISKDNNYVVRTHEETEKSEIVRETQAILDSDYVTVQYKAKDTVDNSDYLLLNKKDVLTISGRYNGEKVDKSFDLGPSPFFHDPSLCLTGFVLSGKKEIVFQVINPKDYNVYEMIAKRKGVKKIKIGDEQVEAIEVYWTLNDFRSMFFNQTYFFRASDGIFLTAKEPYNGKRTTLALN